MYKEIKNNLNEQEELFEMAVEKSAAAANIMSHISELNKHLIKCLLIQNNTGYLDHWGQEIYAALNDVPKLKHDKKLPDEDFIRENTIGYFEDRLPNKLDNIIKVINKQEKTNITKYNKDLLYECIIDYYNWLIPILAVEGEIDDSDDVKNKINELITKYNELNK